MNDQFLDIEEIKEKLHSIRNYEESIVKAIGAPKILDKYEAPLLYKLDFEENFNLFIKALYNNGLMKQYKIMKEIDEYNNLVGVYIDKPRFAEIYNYIRETLLIQKYFDLARDNKLELSFGPIEGYVNQDGSPYEDFVISNPTQK